VCPRNTQVDEEQEYTVDTVYVAVVNARINGANTVVLEECKLSTTRIFRLDHCSPNDPRSYADIYCRTYRYNLFYLDLITGRVAESGGFWAQSDA